jgi:tetratricopeptide (TPR) repeat protein
VCAVSVDRVFHYFGKKAVFGVDARRGEKPMKKESLPSVKLGAWISIVLVGAFLPIGSVGAPCAAAQEVSRDARQTIEQVVTDINRRSTTALKNAIDLPVIWHTVFDDLEVPTGLKNGFIQGFESKYGENLERVVGRIPQNGYAKVLRVSGDKALVRLDFGENGYGYWEYRLQPDYAGNLRIVDWYDYSMGQNYTDSLRQIIVLASPSSSMLQRFFGFADEDTSQLLEAFKALSARDFNQFFKVAETLPPDIKNSRIMLLMSVQIAQQSGDMNRYQMTLRSLATHFRNDPTLAFILLDHFFLEGNYDVAIELIEKLQNHMGVEDSGILGMKANALLMAQKLDESAAAGRKAVELEPTLEAPYWSLLKAYALSEKYAEAVSVAMQIEKNFGYILDTNAFAADADYQKFMQSKPFTAWQKSR